MGFFEELPDLPSPPRTGRDPRHGPSRAEVPVGVALSLLAGRSDDAAVALGPVLAYSDGFMIGATVLLREQPDDTHFFDPFSRHHGQAKERIVRLALVFADGTVAQALHAFARTGDRTLWPQGGGGDGTHWSTSFWSWPLPPPGQIDVVCAWPAHGIAETRTSFDAQPILDAAARVETLWPEPGGEGSRSSSTSYIGPS